MTEDELKQILTAYAERAVSGMMLCPQIRVEVTRMDDDGHVWLSGDVDFLHDGSERGERAAERSLNVLNKIVDSDDRMDGDSEGFGDGVVGLSVDVHDVS